MLTDINIIAFAVFLTVFLTPLFIKIRSRMSKKVTLSENEFRAYTRSKILQISFSHFLVLILGFIFLVIFFFGIKNRINGSNFSQSDLLFFIAFVFLYLLVTYGAGSYIASIIIEQCLLKPNQNHPVKLKALRLYNEYFHGPFSHVLFFSGTNTILLLFSIYEKNYPTSATFFNIFLYGIFGAILGCFFCYWQIWSGTWKHQIPWFITIFILHLIFVYTNKINFSLYPFNFFYLIFALTLNTGLLFKFFFYRKRGKIYRYNLKIQFDQLFK